MCFTSYQLQNIVLVGRMVAILDEVLVSSFRYFHVTVISRAHFFNTFNIVKMEMDYGYLAHTVALAVW